MGGRLMRMVFQCALVAGGGVWELQHCSLDRSFDCHIIPTPTDNEAVEEIGNRIECVERRG